MEEKYPAWIPALAALHSLAMYGIGLYVFSLYSEALVAAYLLYIIWIELKIMHGSCTRCYYYGKLCGLGRGKIAGMLFKKSKEGFSERQICWKDLLPDFLVFLMPLAAGIILLATNFNWELTGLLALLVALGTAGNGAIRGIVCGRCKQRELGCPAEQMFKKK